MEPHEIMQVIRLVRMRARDEDLEIDEIFIVLQEEFENGIESY